MRPIFGVLNHYRPKVDNEKEIDIGHGRGMAKGRADGRLMLKNFLDSLEESMEIDYDVVIVDNASSNLVNNVDIPLKYNYIYNDDDTFGVTRGWNLCANFGYMNGNDFIFVCNDDLTFNKTINDFFVDVSSGFDLKNTLFGVTSPGAPGQHNQSFHKKGASYDITNQNHPVGGGLHGWFYGFSRDYYKEYQNDGKLFDVEETTPWQGNERFQEKHRAMGSRQVIIGSVLVEHGFSGGWRHRREVCEVK
tara:strand:+ start:9348 stop:10091 length:744 start_codon:yes stop_codon:yes gene_type:complete